MATYTTPEISRHEFDDWNPGRGLDTVTDTAGFIRHRYGVTQVSLTGTSSTVRFQVSGTEASVSAFASLYGDGDAIEVSRQTIREMRSVLVNLGREDAAQARVKNVRAMIVNYFGSLENYLRQYGRR